MNGQSVPKEYASFWARFGAFLIDSIVAVTAALIVAFVVGFTYGISGGDESGASALGFTVGIIIPWLYWALLESSSSQATLGKRAVGIIVTDASGNRMSFARATGRNFAKILSTVILLIGFIMAAFTGKKQALHDMIADTLVVKA